TPVLRVIASVAVTPCRISVSGSPTPTGEQGAEPSMEISSAAALIIAGFDCPTRSVPIQFCADCQPAALAQSALTNLRPPALLGTMPSHSTVPSRLASELQITLSPKPLLPVCKLVPFQLRSVNPCTCVLMSGFSTP